MTNLSLVPEIAAHSGINFVKLIEMILKDASTKSKKILIYIFLLIIITTFNNKNFNNINFGKIDNIFIKGLEEKENFQLIENLEFLKK